MRSSKGSQALPDNHHFNYYHDFFSHHLSSICSNRPFILSSHGMLFSLVETGQSCFQDDYNWAFYSVDVSN